MAAPPVVARNNFIDNINVKIEQSLINGPPVKVPGQQWALVAVLGPEGTAQRNVKWIYQIYGVFETSEECDQHAQRLNALGYQFIDLHRVPMYQFLPLPPCTKYEQVKYFEKEMQDIMCGYQRQECHAQKALQDRIAFDRTEEARVIAAREAEQKCADGKILD